MKELQEILKTAAGLATGEKAILATVVDVQGSSYRLAGARMLVDAGGNSIGTVSGGCLEADVLERAKQVLATGRAQIITYDTTKDENSVFGLGMGCRGVVRVLLEAVDRESRVFQVLRAAADARQRQIIATVIDAPENFNIGGRLFYDAKEFMPAQLPESLQDDDNLKSECVRAHEDRLKSYGEVFETGQGAFELFIEVIEPPVSVLLFGAGHDARPLTDFAAGLGWQVTVIDHRAAWATVERFPGAKNIINARPENLDENIFNDENSVAVVMTHSYERDGVLLPRLLKSKCRYIGALGPKNRTEKLLAESGQQFTGEQLSRLYAPVGLDIGADSPESIALSILAEIQAVLAGRAGGNLRDRAGSIYNR